MKLILFLFLFSSQAIAQNYFTIEEIGDEYSIEKINSAFTEANFCGYFKRSLNSEIHLDDGAIITLLPANNLILEEKCIKEDDFQIGHIVFSIDENGHLFKFVQSNSK